MEPLETITIEPDNKPAQHCIIWLHGLGADGHDFINIVPALGLPKDHHIRFVFPHAPYRPITINQHMTMRGWYDIYALDSLDREDETGIRASCQALDNLILQQNLPSEQIMLAGFSQGGAIALLHGISHKNLFAGIIGLSTYLPFLHSPSKKPPLTHKKLPILLCHGTYDDIIPEYIGKETHDYLNRISLHTEWETYPMGHHVCNDEIHYIGQWLSNQLFPNKT